MVGLVAFSLVFCIVGSMLCLVRHGIELCLLILRLRLVADIIPFCGLRLDDIIPSCKSFPALSLQVSLAFLVLLGHVYEGVLWTKPKFFMFFTGDHQ